MNDEYSRGDLLYLPADVTLYQFGAENSDTGSKQAPRRYEKTTKPINVLALGKRPPDYIEILYESQRWMVRKKDVYRAHE